MSLIVVIIPFIIIIVIITNNIIRQNSTAVGSCMGLSEKKVWMDFVRLCSNQMLTSASHSYHVCEKTAKHERMTDEACEYARHHNQ